MPSVTESPIPLCLRKILWEGLSGIITVKGDNFEKKVYFKNGSVLFATTNVIQERLGEILFKSGKITRQEFWSIHKMIENRNQKIGKLFVENGILSEKDVFQGIQLQIQSIVLSMFFLNSGEWSFEEKDPEIPGDSQFGLNLAKIIHEGTVRYLQNTNLYINQYFSKSPVTREIPKEIENVLPEKLIKFHSSLAVFSNRSNEEIPKELGISEKKYWEQLLPVYLLGIVDFEIIDINEEERENIEKVTGMYNKIKEERVNYYEVLGLKDDASSEDIRNAYFNYAKKFHPDRITTAPDPGISEKANFVFSEINRAYDTLSDNEKKRQYDMDKIKEKNGEGAGPDKSVERASLLHRKAKTLFNQKNFWEATTLLEESVRLNPNRGACFLLLGMSQMNIPTMIRAAEKNLSKAVDLDPWSAEPLVALGILFLNENLEKRAESFFRKAISIDPENKIAKKRLKDMLESSSKGVLKKSIFKKK
ncbi:MAG: DnaJ domain-containing protein [Acidobacteriota bacterium]